MSGTAHERCFLLQSDALGVEKINMKSAVMRSAGTKSSGFAHVTVTSLGYQKAS